ncbi:hypothetical protein [Streptomyces sp. TRM68367]|uniref:hypothetical protein n=1 Tax=Streptomyces sp. TRM68367 TaxID=2758415 RepID=UPI00165AF8F5|nr:hypothetical protein [Streptomyces sp. TRM68367]MBC9731218.1 hypothetical protein [Streptomyces sp. TRM68367]
MSTSTLPDGHVVTRLTIGCDRFGCLRESTGLYTVPRSMLRPDCYAIHRAVITQHRGWQHNDLGDDLCPDHREDTPANAPTEVTL